MSEVNEVLERVASAGIEMSEEQIKEYLAMPDILGEAEKGEVLPIGFKRCGRCSDAKKFYLFNRNSGSKTNTSGSCKECQKQTAKKSYDKTKVKRNYKKYYAENKEKKQEQARKYYAKNKEHLKEKHKEYLATKKGKSVMRKAHSKRRKALAKNSGVPYTREMIIERDSSFIGLEYPVCYLCKEPITSTSGADLHLDHVVPVIQGGLDCFTNIASTHALCNLTREKDARNLTEEQVVEIVTRASAYININPELFED